MSERTIKPKDARELVGTGKARAIDVRNLEHGEQHAPGAAVVGDGDLEETAERLLRGDEDITLLVFGADGDEGERAAEKLREAGYEARAIDGGWEAWRDADLPVQPDEDEEYEGPELKQPGTGASMGPADDEEEDPADDEDPGAAADADDSELTGADEVDADDEREGERREEAGAA